MSCTELSEGSDTPLQDGTLSPTLRLENLLKKCKDTLGTHLATQQAFQQDEYFPLVPVESDSSVDILSWEDVNQELLSRGLPLISIHIEEGDNCTIPGSTLRNINLIITQLLQENREQKTKLYSQTESCKSLEFCSNRQKQEITQLRELLSTKDRIIGQLNERCSMMSGSCKQTKAELDSPHLKEIEDIIEEGKLSKEAMVNAQQRVEKLECELMELKSSQYGTNPFLQPDVFSQTFDKEGTFLLPAVTQRTFLAENEVGSDNSNQLLRQIGSFIQLLCNEIGVDTIAELYTSIRSIRESKHNSESVVLPVFEQCVQLMNNSALPLKLRPQSYERITLQGFVELVRLWVGEMCGVKHLQDVVQQISCFAIETCSFGKETYFPFNSAEVNPDEWSILEMSEFLQAIFLSSTDGKLLSFDVLKGLFSHFAKLFKVHEPVNMLTLMSDLQRRFEEMENVLRVCKIAIGLKENSSNSSLIQSLQNVSETSHRDAILPISTFDHVELLQRVKFYEQFFFHFEWIITKIFNILSIDKLSQIIPKIELLANPTT